MNVFSSLNEASRNKEIRHIALGFFDGLHLGHREVIIGNKTPGTLAQTAMVSFRNHPQTVLFRDQPITLITGLSHKEKILFEWGVGNCVLLPFDVETSRKTSDAFLRELRGGFPRLESVRVGENFRFGHGRTGNPGLLKEWGRAEDLDIEVVASLLDGEQPISSSRIRSLLNQKDINEASKLLGRPYSIWGRVVEGCKRGTPLGFPTANINTADGLLLPLGVYQGYVDLGGQRHKAAINIGNRPTMDRDLPVWVEAHLLDFSGDLYGQEINLVVSGFLREEKHFESVDSLKTQITKDIDRVRISPVL